MVLNRMRAQDIQGLKAFLKAREFLLTYRNDYEATYRNFIWPELDTFNWALDYFDTLAYENNNSALRIVDDNGSEVRLSFSELSRRSNQVANFLRGRGACRDDRIIVQLP